MELEHEATVRLHAEHILKVIAGESPNGSGATKARVIVNEDVILSVGPESKANVFDAIIQVDGPVLEPAVDLVNPLFSHSSNSAVVKLFLTLLPNIMPKHDR